MLMLLKTLKPSIPSFVWRWRSFLVDCNLGATSVFLRTDGSDEGCCQYSNYLCFVLVAVDKAPRERKQRRLQIPLNPPLSIL